MKKVLSCAHVRLLDQRARNAHDESEQTLAKFPAPGKRNSWKITAQQMALWRMESLYSYISDTTETNYSEMHVPFRATC